METSTIHAETTTHIETTAYVQSTARVQTTSVSLVETTAHVDSGKCHRCDSARATYALILDLYVW